MSDSKVLAAEYRAFVKELHPASIEALVAVEEFWQDKVWPKIPPHADGETKNKPLPAETFREFSETARPPLLILASGHPDPDVRVAAEKLLLALEALVVSHIGDPPADFEGTPAQVEKMLDCLRALRRALYHAPYRVERPTPDFDGELRHDTAVRVLIRRASV